MYQDATDALRAAYHGRQLPIVVAHKPGKGWILSDPANPAKDANPEILCLKAGTLPLPLTEDGAEVLASIYRSLSGSVRKGTTVCAVRHTT